jgi:pyruvate/2-oxoglutarate dehydrogenase complex dihydrolipoamide dehydrogenase (E3) component/uncharacterized membrane protein YdjX (TVP38/TMEM64 family)
MHRARALPVIVLVAAALAWWLADAQRHVSLESLHEMHRLWGEWSQNHPVGARLGFFALYVLGAALSLPGLATGLTLLAGALFGWLEGCLLVSFASSLGATAAFLSSRFVLRDAVQRRFSSTMAKVDAGIKRDGAWYLFGVRLVPVFPFFLVNLLMGLTSLPTRTFYVVSQLGMLPVTMVYVYAGTRLGALHSISDVMSWPLLLTFTLLGLLPWLARRVLNLIEAGRALKGWTRPRHVDCNLIVIGGGSAGLVTSYVAAAARASVTLIERNRMGGDCLNTGCVPSKSLLHTASVVSMARQLNAQGVSLPRVDLDFAAVMQQVRQSIERIEPHDSVERYRSLGVDVIEGEARLISPWEVEVSTVAGPRRISARHVVIATGARPRLPDLPGLSDRDCLTSDTLWGLRTLPRRLLVLGGGPLGCEMALAFARLGSEVTLIERADRVMSREDEDVSDVVAARLSQEGVTVHTGLRALRIEGEPADEPARPSSRRLLCEPAEVRIEFDRMLCALGREPNLQGLGLDALGVGVAPSGYLELDSYLRTRVPSILAVGDVTGLPQFTHAAGHMAWHAAINALFGRFRQFRVDWRVLPQVTYLDPEVARVGLNELEARAQGLAVEVTRFELSGLDRAIVDRAEQGFIKVLTATGSDRIVGATIVAPRAGESIAEFALAMKHGLGLGKILNTIHAYPTYTDANRLAAGQWRRARLPQRALRWAAWLHRWERG